MTLTDLANNLSSAPDELPIALHQVADRLYQEFDHRWTRSGIGALVAQCCCDLCCSPPAALPELVERLARQRLLGAVVR